MFDIDIGLAFAAGMASFFSPCVFSLVPVYISYLGGRSASLAGTERSTRDRFDPVFQGMAFVLGFSIVFISLGVAAGYLGGALASIRLWLSRIGGIIVIVFGLNIIGWIRIPFLQYDLRIHSPLKRTTGFLQSVLMGIFFSAGWTPCVGPVLGAILTLALNGGSIGRGALLLTFYSLGLGVPFLIAALGVGWVTQLLKKYGKTLRIIEIVMGIMLVIVGVMLFMGTFNELARFGIFIDFGI